MTGAQADVFNFWDRTNPFAAECYIQPGSASVSGDKTVLGAWGAAGRRQWLMYLDVGRPAIHASTDGSAITEAVGSTALVAGTWYHLVLTRNASAVYRLFVDGALAVTLDSLTGTDLFNIPAGSVELAIGSIAGKRSFMGHMHGVRVTHGVDRYFDTDGFIGAWPENVDQFPASVRYGAPPVRRVRVDAEISWDQQAAGTLDITDQLLGAFAAAGSPAGVASSYTGQGLEIGLT